MSNDQPQMIEINLRLPGLHSVFNRLETLVYSSDSVSKLCDCMHGHSVNHNLNAKILVRALIISNQHDFTIPKFEASSFASVKSFYTLEQYATAGKIQPPAKQLADCLGIIVLNNTDANQLEADIINVRNILKSKYGL